MSAFGLFGGGVAARVLCPQARMCWRWASAVGGMSIHRPAPCSRNLFDFARMTPSDMANRHAPVAWYDKAGYGFLSRATAHYGLELPTVTEVEAVGIHRRSTFDMAAVTGARRCAPSASDPCAFREKEAALALGNVKLGWHGAVPGAVTTSAAAFRRPWALLGADSEDGGGLHLSSLWFPSLRSAGLFSRATAHYGLEPPTGTEVEAVGIHRMSTFDMAAVTGARRCAPSASDPCAFREKEAALALGNVKLGWHGAVPEAVTTSAAAFRRPNWALLDLHLSPLRFPHHSMGIAEAKYDGMRLFVPGLPAAINAGPEQWYTRESELKSSGGVELFYNQSWRSWSIISCESMNPCDQGPLPSCIPVALDKQKQRRGIKRFLSSFMLQKLEDYFDSDTMNGVLLKKDMERALNSLKTGSTPILVSADLTSKVMHVQKAVPLSKKTTGIRQVVNPWSAYRYRKRSLPYGAAKQSYRSYSTAKRQENAVNNTYIFSLNGDGHEILGNFQGLIGWIRTWCRFHGQVIDVSTLYGPGREVFTTPVDGTIYITVKYQERSITLILAGRDLYIKGWIGKNGTFEMKPRVQGQYYTTDPNRKVLSFSSNYSNICPDIGKTRIGQHALESAFEVLYKSEGKGSDEEMNAISIFAVNICEAARFQTIFRLVCESFWEFSVIQLDSESKISRQAHPNSWWVRQLSYYSGQAMKEIDLLLSGIDAPGIINRGGGTITSASEIISVIRILLQSKYVKGEFAYRRLPPEIPMESPPNAEGVSLTPLSSVLDEWNFEEAEEDPENGSEEDDETLAEDTENQDTEGAEQKVEQTKEYSSHFPMVGRPTQIEKKPVQCSFTRQFVPAAMRRRFCSSARNLYTPPLQRPRPPLQRAPLQRFLLQKVAKASCAISKIIRFLP